jgi:hypothetical protein
LTLFHFCGIYGFNYIKLFINKEVFMGYETRIQLIKRKKSQQFYVNFPSAVAQAMGFQKSELFEWIITPDGELILHRVGKEGKGEGAKKNVLRNPRRVRSSLGKG